MTLPTLFPSALRRARFAILLACLTTPGFSHAGAQPLAKSAAAAQESADGADMRAREAIASETNRYLEAGDYKGLEALYRRIRGPGQRTPSGIWKQALLYNQLRGFGQWRTDAAYWDTVQARAKAWQKQYPTSVPARLFEAYMLLKRAEANRGSGFYNTLTEQQRRDLSLGSAAAMRVLEDTQALAAKAADPEWHRAMLNVFPYTNQFTQAHYQEKIGAAMARYPNYHEAYFTAAGFSMAHWNGAPDAVEQLAQELNKAAGKEQGAMYARLYWYLDQSAYKGKIFEVSQADWPTMRASFEVLITQYPDPWNLNAYAYFACLANDVGAMAPVLARLGQQIDLRAWGENGAATHARCAAATVADPQFDSKQAAARKVRLRRLLGETMQHAAAQRARKEYKEELDTLHKAEDLDRALGWVSMPVQYNLAVAFFTLKRYEETVGAISAGLAAQPAFPDAYWMRGRALEALGRKDEAREDFDKGARYLRKALPGAWAGLNPTQRANVADMQRKFLEYGFETPTFPES
ncbi:hypothetical protein IV454_14060 [Massilia antarctica]|uniref:DUF4034 domain-containing protein n=1 Tax=Massilia antarctica TaxID=2765360 RepID=A0AA48WIX4_9BURK|nr:hypothetical protein [Massilia antarctica]QPI52507.1 hypothetical protein IV454_14060 [Massilia antarctica]